MLTAQMETFVWWVDPVSWRAEWKCATTTSGGQCVMIPGAVLMLMWPVDNWDTLIMVNIFLLGIAFIVTELILGAIVIYKNLTFYDIHIQVLQHTDILTLEEAQEEYIWITCTVMVMNHNSLTVDTVELEYTTVITLMMLE